jgi:hypothetical protein
MLFVQLTELPNKECESGMRINLFK